MVSLADAGMVTVGVVDSAGAGAVTLAAPVDIPDSPEYGRSVVIGYHPESDAWRGLGFRVTWIVGALIV